MSKKTKNYFVKSFLAIVIAIGVFFGLKQVMPKNIFSDTKSGSDGIVVDSLALAAMNDSTGAQEENLPDSLMEDSLQNRIKLHVSDNSEGLGYLSSFYEKLYKLESTGKGKVRIAYFGDSMTDGDFIVQDIRNSYQSAYGGKGVGFVGITSLSASARGTVSHQYSKDWLTQSCLTVKNPKRSFGIDGQVFFAARGGSSWVKFTAGNQENISMLYNPTLFYGSSGNDKASITVSSGKKDSASVYMLPAGELLNTVSLGNTAKSLKISVQNGDSIPFYGVNFDDGVGVHVDNFSIRGNSGLPLSLYNKNLMNALDNVLQYDLIVLQYGTNVLGYNTLDYTWYENKMIAVVNHLRECFPKADILIVSVGDRAKKVETEMQTDKAVAPLIKAQRKYAAEAYAGFINLQALMGGDGAIVNWVNDGFANKDYTHVNAKGARKLSSLIYDELDKGYTEYKKTK
ncbi:GDSL-type esterase/lipase family protein [Dysgonomonas macrotermitis]|uniref:GDSL-like Lipase/Acylhydrolase family protein n=1 Tax=Dysgonomonas macrotermitis TaxID=1346286 RepID=A0A1M4YKI1_9BACT|nr:GDSL-type esterase/lipase family protein [Dysgonomonas macrotermitis]SHF06259.1 GDSL-like Lipase/Acylhydrolase family protein [Dysgonomonas macrotermitis]